MEIKTALAKPLWLTHMLAELDIQKRRFSKYGTEYTNTLRHAQADEIDQNRQNFNKEKVDLGSGTTFRIVL